MTFFLVSLKDIVIGLTFHNTCPLEKKMTFMLSNVIPSISLSVNAGISHQRNGISSYICILEMIALH